MKFKCFRPDRNSLKCSKDMWFVAIILDSTDIGNFHNFRKDSTTICTKKITSIFGTTFCPLMKGKFR